MFLLSCKCSKKRSKFKVEIFLRIKTEEGSKTTVALERKVLNKMNNFLVIYEFMRKMRVQFQKY